MCLRVVADCCMADCIKIGIIYVLFLDDGAFVM